LQLIPFSDGYLPR